MGLAVPTSPPEGYQDIYDRGSGETFPCHLLEGQTTSLCLFAAGFYGMHDAYWMAEAGLVATCIDTDAFKLGVMQDIYPDTWTFVCEDAFDYVENVQGKWDIVTADPNSNFFERVQDLAALWCSLARSSVVLGAGLETRQMSAPEGWQVTDVRKRSNHLGGVFWVVMEPA